MNTNILHLIPLLIQVESGGRDNAIGDAGRAIGPLQIHRSVVQDYNRWNKTCLQHSEMTNRSLAIKVCMSYLQHYGPKASTEALARKWNGGPAGDRKTSTVGYWHKVRKLIK